MPRSHAQRRKGAWWSQGCGAGGSEPLAGTELRCRNLRRFWRRRTVERRGVYVPMPLDGTLNNVWQTLRAFHHDETLCKAQALNLGVMRSRLFASPRCPPGAQTPGCVLRGQHFGDLFGRQSNFQGGGWCTRPQASICHAQRRRSTVSFGVTRLTFIVFKDALETSVLKPGLS